jgi:hypothetical protein
VLRTELFTINFTFNTLDDAQVYADSRLSKLNEHSLIDEERQQLLPYRPPLELAAITTAKVDKTSLISVDTVKYSVPEEFVGETVIVKKYHDEIRVFSQNNEITRQKQNIRVWYVEDRYSSFTFHSLSFSSANSACVNNAYTNR